MSYSTIHYKYMSYLYQRLIKELSCEGCLRCLQYFVNKTVDDTHYTTIMWPSLANQILILLEIYIMYTKLFSGGISGLTYLWIYIHET